MFSAKGKRSVVRSVRQAVCALLSLSLMLGIFADLNIHVAHAGHSHAPHDLTSSVMNELNPDVCFEHKIDCADQSKGKKDRSHSPMVCDHCPTCFAMLGLEPELFAAPTGVRDQQPSIELFRPHGVWAALERPPKSIL